VYRRACQGRLRLAVVAWRRISFLGIVGLLIQGPGRGSLGAIRRGDASRPHLVPRLKVVRDALCPLAQRSNRIPHGGLAR